LAALRFLPRCQTARVAASLTSTAALAGLIGFQSFACGVCHSSVIEETKLVVGTNRLMIMFDAKNLQLKQWTVTDPQGLDTTGAVYNIDSGRKADPNLFVINYQPDSRSQVPTLPSR
jgi:Outer membrane lipoprotein carrier protein LolA